MYSVRSLLGRDMTWALNVMRGHSLETTPVKCGGEELIGSEHQGYAHPPNICISLPFERFEILLPFRKCPIPLIVIVLTAQKKGKSRELSL